MGRKNLIIDFSPVEDGDMSDASIVGESTSVKNFDQITYVAKWTGGQTTNGDLSVEVAKKPKSPDQTPDWVELDFATTISADGPNGSHRLIIDVSFDLIRPIYTRTNGSASGVLNIEAFATNRGA